MLMIRFFVYLLFFFSAVNSRCEVCELILPVANVDSSSSSSAASDVPSTNVICTNTSNSMEWPLETIAAKCHSYGVQIVVASHIQLQGIDVRYASAVFIRGTFPNLKSIVLSYSQNVSFVQLNKVTKLTHLIISQSQLIKTSPPTQVLTWVSANSQVVLIANTPLINCQVVLQECRLEGLSYQSWIHFSLSPMYFSKFALINNTFIHPLHDVAVSFRQSQMTSSVHVITGNVAIMTVAPSNKNAFLYYDSYSLFVGARNCVNCSNGGFVYCNNSDNSTFKNYFPSNPAQIVLYAKFHTVIKTASLNQICLRTPGWFIKQASNAGYGWSDPAPGVYKTLTVQLCDGRLYQLGDAETLKTRVAYVTPALRSFSIVTMNESCPDFGFVVDWESEVGWNSMVDPGSLTRTRSSERTVTHARTLTGLMSHSVTISPLVPRQNSTNEDTTTSPAPTEPWTTAGPNPTTPTERSTTVSLFFQSIASSPSSNSTMNYDGNKSSENQLLWGIPSAATKAPMYVAGAIAGAFSPTAANKPTTAARMLAVMRCRQRVGGDDDDENWPDWANYIFVFPITSGGGGNNGCARAAGAVVTTIAVTIIAILIICWMIHRVLQPTPSSSPSLQRTDQQQDAIEEDDNCEKKVEADVKPLSTSVVIPLLHRSRFHWASVFVALLLSYYGPNTTEAAAFLLFHCGDGGAVPLSISVVALALHFASVLSLLFLLLKKFDPLCTSSTSSLCQHQFGSVFSVVQEALRPFWESCRLLNSTPIRLVTLIDLLTAHLLAFIAGVQPNEDHRSCSKLLYVMLAISVVFLLYLCAFRPYAQRFELGFAIAVALGQCVLSAMAAAARGAPTTAAATRMEKALVAFNILIGAQLVVLTGWEALLMYREWRNKTTLKETQEEEELGENSVPLLTVGGKANPLGGSKPVVDKETGRV